MSDEYIPEFEPFDIDEALDNIDLEFSNYTPSEDAIEFFNIIRLVFGEDFEIPNAKVHYFMVDMLYGNVTREMFPYSNEINSKITINPTQIGLIAARGLSKSTITTLFYPIVVAIKGSSPVTGKGSHMLILSDSQKGGSRDQAKTMGNVLENSEFCNNYFESMRCTETEIELVRANKPKENKSLKSRHMLIKFKGIIGGGIRSGSRNPVTLDRYFIVIGDDVIKNESDSYSTTIMTTVDNALDSDILYAMRSANTQIVLINTPYHKGDPIYRKIEGGTYTPLVVPICKTIHTKLTKAEFIGAWEANHPYKSVMLKYRNVAGTVKESKFMQELMLRVASSADRLVKDEDIKWYSRSTLLKNLSAYNIYMTTDYTASNTTTQGDLSGSFAWAVSANKDWYLLDLTLKRQTIEEQYIPTLKYVTEYGRGRYPYIGVEINGQQQINIYSLERLRMERGLAFGFAKQIGKPYGSRGVDRKGDKHENFMRFHPMMQDGKVYFPEEMKDHPYMKELMKELEGVTYTKLTAKFDDGIDCLSMVAYLDVIYPNVNTTYDPTQTKEDNGVWTKLEAPAITTEVKSSYVF